MSGKSCTGVPPIIDGHLDEPAWKAADVGGNFRQIEPTEGAPASERTEIRVLYDNTSLYVGVRLYDRTVAYTRERDPDDPGIVVAHVIERDSGKVISETRIAWNSFFGDW